MIEVEKRYQPTEEQLRALLGGAEFLGEFNNQDIYYDYPDLRITKYGVRLRKRSGYFELKIREKSGVDTEIEDRKEIEEYFQTDDLEKFIDENMVLVRNYTTKRKKYTKEGITIDVDETDFGYKICEFEILVEREDEVEEAKEKIINFVKKYNVDMKKVNPKGKEYMRLFKPEMYQKIYRDKN